MRKQISYKNFKYKLSEKLLLVLAEKVNFLYNCKR